MKYLLTKEELEELQSDKHTDKEVQKLKDAITWAHEQLKHKQCGKAIYYR